MNLEPTSLRELPETQERSLNVIKEWCRAMSHAFLGLTTGDAMPHGQAISDLRQMLIDTRTYESSFDALLVHLQKEHGVALANEGVMVDASFPEVPQTLQDNAKLRSGKDLDACWTKKNYEMQSRWPTHLACVRERP